VLLLIVTDEGLDMLVLKATGRTATLLQLHVALVYETEVEGIEDDGAGRAGVC
jgi:hypothetical protein